MKPNKPPVLPLKSRISVFSVERGSLEVDGAALVVNLEVVKRAQAADSRAQQVFAVAMP